MVGTRHPIRHRRFRHRFLLTPIFLHEFRTDNLKIDREFIKDVESDPNDAEIVKATIALGSVLGMATIAEGVETPGQAEFLVRHGCDQVQGHLYGRPTTPDTIERNWLLKQKKSPGP